jgi:outer membrane lipoprotein-sorting protein
MTRLARFAVALLTSASLATPALAIAPDSTDPKAIMQAVEDRPTGDKSKGRLVMTIIDKSGRKRQRVVASRAMDFAEGRRQIMVFESPADVKGTGLLSIDYDDGDKDDDQWLYLPSLHKSTRISSGDKSGSFMGTDLSYADMTANDPDHWTYTLLEQSATVDGEECWLIEAVPATEKAKSETGYLKTHVWVSKKKLMPLQLKAWVIAGRKIKLIKFDDIKQVDGIWVAHKIMARTVRGKTPESTTVLEFSDLSFGNADVGDDLFTQRQLEKGL